jgi:hypothetical protein
MPRSPVDHASAQTGEAVGGDPVIDPGRRTAHRPEPHDHTAGSTGDIFTLSVASQVPVTGSEGDPFTTAVGSRPLGFLRSDEEGLSGP